MNFNKIKKIFSCESFIVWIRYFRTVTIKSIFINIILPLITCILLYFFAQETISKACFEVFSISSILMGFCASILIMLFTIEGENIKELKKLELKNSKLSLHQALVYKFSFITINLLVLILVSLLATFLDFNGNIIYKLYVILILMNTVLTLIEALTNVIFVLGKST